MPKDKPSVGSRYFSAAQKTLSSLLFYKVRSAVFALMLLIIMIIGALFGFADTRVYAQTPNTTLNYQARILNFDGSLVPDGNYNLEFKIYDSQTVSGTPDQGACTKNTGTADTTCLWVETRTGGNAVRVVNGYVSVNLGSVTPFSSTIPWGNNLYVTMRVGGTGSPTWDTEMTDGVTGYRMKITAVPLAFVANNVLSGDTNAASTNSDNIVVQTGDALGTTSNSGNITVDVGTATGTTGSLLFGTSNASAITIGNSSATTTLQGSISLTGSGTALTVTNDVQVDGNTTLGSNTTDTLTVNANATFTGSLTVQTGDVFTNAGSTLFTAISISDDVDGGVLGSTAAATVDVATTFNVNQTTASQTFTLASPTTTTSGRVVYVNNVGSADFTLEGSVLSAGNSSSYIWNGTAWVQTITFVDTSGVTTVGALDGGTANANSASISGTTIYLQSASATYAGLVNTATQTFAGAKTFSSLLTASTGLTVTGAITNNLTDNTADILDIQEGTNNYININTTDSSENISFGNTTTNPSYNFLGSGTLTVAGATTSTGLLTGSAGLTVTGATTSINASSNFNTNINTGTSTGTVAIGNSASTTTVLGTTTINTTGTATTGIGNSGAVLTLSGSSILLNSGTLQRTAAGTTNLDLVDGANTTFALINSGAGVANLTVDGSITVATLGSADNASFLCRNTSNILAGCSYTPLNPTLTDNITDALDIQEGTNNYININTTDGSEEIQFGNATTNPDFTFLGSGALIVAGASTFNSGVTAKGQLLADGTGANQTQFIVRANSGQTVANPLVLLQDSGTTELARINATTSSLYFGNAAGGSSAAGANNTGIGASALGAVSTGTANTTLGSGALASVSVNSNNTAVGYNAGNLTTGSNNIFLGYQAGDNVTSGNNNIIIGYDLNADVATGDNQLNIGGILQGDTSTLAASFNGALTVTGLTTLNGGLTVQTGDTFTFNGDGFTDFTGGGLVNTGGVLTVDATSATGFFQNGGNSFSGTATLGTNDANNLVLETANTTRLTLDQSNVAYFGNGVTNAIPSAFTIQGTGGSGTDVAGAGLTFAGGQGTGAGTGGSLIFQTATAGVSGASLNALTTRLTIDQAGLATFANNILVSGNADVDGTLFVGTGNAFQVSSGGAVTAVGVNSGAGLLQGSLGLTVTGATTSINASSNFNTNINTGTSTGTVAIGNSASTTTVLGTTTINTTGTATTGIGNSGAVLTLSGSSILLNSGTLQRTAAGTTNLDLVDGANTTFALINSGAGVANLTVDGSITVATLGSADNASFLCRNTSNILAGCSYTPLNPTLTDNITDALDIQEGTNNYININTTDGSEEIQFGNATTNPDFTFLGSGNTNIAGQLTVNGTAADQIQLVVKANASQTATTPLFQAQTSVGAEIYSIRAPDEYSVYLGYRAGYIDDGTGGQNTGVGSNALLNNVAGYYNVAIGSNALSSNDDGASNIAIGQQALTTNVSGTQNTAVGGSALINSTGNNNTALGFESGSLNTGAENLFLGYKAGDNLTTGSYNILIGNEIDAISATGNYQLNIGNILYGTTINGTGTTLSTGNLGVGTSSPGARLEVKSQAGGSQVGLIVDNNTSNGDIFVANDNGSAVFTIADGGAVTLGNGSTTARTISVATTTSNAIGANLTISAGTAGAGAGAFAGGVLTLQGGNAAGTGNANGGNVVISGGTGVGTGVQGLVVVNTAAFSAATVQAFTGNANITQANIDTYGTILISSNAAGYTATLTDPTTTTTGRVIYVTNTGAYDMTLSVNGGGSGNTVTLKPNTTATMVWNGADWTAAGASSSTDLQAAYNNTATSAGGAELVLNAPGGAADGLTIRNNDVSPIVGGLLEVQTSIGSNLFTVNNNATEYADNGGAENTTFTMWTGAFAGGTVTRNTTAAYVATGQGSVSVVTAGAGHGAENVLTTTLTANLDYHVSYTVKGTTNFATLETIFSKDGTNTATTTCNTAQTVTTTVWSRIDCTFTAPSSGITSSNSIFIRQTDGTSRTFYIDNFSVTVGADVNHAADGSVDSALGTNWTQFDADGGAGTTTLTRDTSTIYDTSGAVSDVTTAHVNEGLRNNMAITPQVSTQYLVTFYAKSSNSFTNITVGFLPAGGNSTPVSAQLCYDYNTQTVSTSTWTKITCIITTPSSGISDPDLVIYQPTATARTFYVDALSITLNTNTASNVQIGGGNKGGPTTLFTLDRSAGAPIADNNDAYLGSMYYDTVTGRIQCYEADGWGACGAAPDNIVNLNPEYAGAVLNGSGVGTMTADFCSNDTALSVNSTLCSTGQAKNFYRWTSPQATSQTYSIYVTYQLPATFNGFSSDDTVQLVGRVDSTTNASVTYEMYKSTGSAVTQCGTGETNVITGGGGSANTWYSYGINGNEATGCSFSSSSASNFIIFKINLKANSNANAYVSTLSFTTTGR